ncbi:MAG: SUMF1/EgtB/PvdO family nonheme iron enzyme [Fibrobacter sp.]|nr:SUMF1/EgtB/PvdO family nonheme iron enzyme [Fibrobacter sp.]
MKRRFFCLLATSLLALVFGCSADGSAVDSDPIAPEGGGGGSYTKSSESKVAESSSSGAEADSTQDSTKTPLQRLSEFIEMVEIPAMELSKGAASYKVSAFSIGKSEVLQGLYMEIIGDIAKEDVKGFLYPVFNVSWYDAVLFCNALSKRVELDTAYVYESADANGVLKNLSVNYEVASVRLPTEMEWEIAARGGTTTTYYWGTDVASKYAYYAQSNGPKPADNFLPNAYGLYDMGGNVAEWTNDWYAAYPTTAQENYTGANSGDYKVVRGGGWSDKAPALASAERDKEDPKYRSQKVGFRVVYSEGF